MDLVSIARKETILLCLLDMDSNTIAFVYMGGSFIPTMCLQSLWVREQYLCQWERGKINALVCVAMVITMTLEEQACCLHRVPPSFIH